MLNDIFWPTLQGTVCTPSTQVLFYLHRKPHGLLLFLAAILFANNFMFFPVTHLTFFGTITDQFAAAAFRKLSKLATCRAQRLGLRGWDGSSIHLRTIRIGLLRLLLLLLLLFLFLLGRLSLFFVVHFL